ncbi:hypothetical protein AB0M46_43610 [Dactylosporangium sp. NPDC051485]|uniref:hypothetical protein n=1 Tax=Dactylosporangium sp. NPDC051485 TaxID=3154846 RepID=UPI0034122180
MSAPRQPDLACIANLRALYESDPHELAVVVLWLGCAATAHEPRSVLYVDKVFRQIAQGVPQLQRVSLLQASPHAAPVRDIVYEAVQVLEHNRLVLWRYHGAEHVNEEITLTRLGRAALLSGDIPRYLTR